MEKISYLISWYIITHNLEEPLTATILMSVPQLNKTRSKIVIFTFRNLTIFCALTMMVGRQ